MFAAIAALAAAMLLAGPDVMALGPGVMFVGDDDDAPGAAIMAAAADGLVGIEVGAPELFTAPGPDGIADDVGGDEFDAPGLGIDEVVGGAEGIDVGLPVGALDGDELDGESGVEFPLLPAPGVAAGPLARASISFVGDEAAGLESGGTVEDGSAAGGVSVEAVGVADAVGSAVGAALAVGAGGSTKAGAGGVDGPEGAEAGDADDVAWVSESGSGTLLPPPQPTQSRQDAATPPRANQDVLGFIVRRSFRLESRPRSVPERSFAPTFGPFLRDGFGLTIQYDTSARPGKGGVGLNPAAPKPHLLARPVCYA